MLRVNFKRNELAIRGQSAGQPDGAVSAERADLKNSSGVPDARQQVQKLALIGSHPDFGEACARAGAKRLVQYGVGSEKMAGDIAVDGSPELSIHNARITRRL